MKPSANRKSASWVRLRAACKDSAADVDVDAHVDHVWLTVEAFKHAKAADSASSEGNAVGRKKEEA